MKVRSKSAKINKAWLNDHVNDPYVRLARKEGYRARAAYKLKEIDEALHLIKPGQVVVDLGAAPGAWSQYVRRRFAPKTAGAGGAAAGALNGTLIALDLMERLEAVTRLERSAISIKQLAFVLGFKDTAYFNRFFRRQLRIPPGRYRREIGRRDAAQRPRPPSFTFADWP